MVVVLVRHARHTGVSRDVERDCADVGRGRRPIELVRTRTLPLGVHVTREAMFHVLQRQICGTHGRAGLDVAALPGARQAHHLEGVQIGLRTHNLRVLVVGAECARHGGGVAALPGGHLESPGRLGGRRIGNGHGQVLRDARRIGREIGKVDRQATLVGRVVGGARVTSGVCGVPNENNTCAQSGCHPGTTNNPANKGSLAINFPNFPTYTPGVTQHLTVTISDPATTQAAWGFEVTARQSSNSATMTGTFSPNDQYTQIMCSQADLNAFKVVCLPGAGQGCNIQSSAPVCPANLPLQYMEHSFAGYVHTQGQGSGTYQFDWTPPSTNVGAITFYIAGNAGVAGVPNKDNDHIYATKFTLVAGSGIPPTLSTVQNGASFLPGFSQGSWITVIGTNLAARSEIGRASCRERG